MYLWESHYQPTISGFICKKLMWYGSHWCMPAESAFEKQLANQHIWGMQLADILQLQQFQDVPHSSRQPEPTTEHGKCASHWSPAQHGTALPAAFMPEFATEQNELWLFLLNSSSFAPPYLPIPIPLPLIFHRVPPINLLRCQFGLDILSEGPSSVHW